MLKSIGKANIQLNKSDRAFVEFSGWECNASAAKAGFCDSSSSGSAAASTVRPTRAVSPPCLRLSLLSARHVFFSRTESLIQKQLVKEAEIILEVNPLPASVDRSVLLLNGGRAPPLPSRCLLPSPTRMNRSSLKETVSLLCTVSYKPTAWLPPGPSLEQGPPVFWHGLLNFLHIFYTLISYRVSRVSYRKHCCKSCCYNLQM